VLPRVKGAETFLNIIIISDLKKRAIFEAISNRTNLDVQTNAAAVHLRRESDDGQNIEGYFS
jgi:hypothetical protein